jgi:type II restriction/modification system DNA methylase subunit YeeA
MTPQFFINKWRRAELTERAGAQSHFNDLCALLDEPTPTDADPAGQWFAFEKGAIKTGGGQGWADVWKKGCFAWEYKGKHKDLGAALRQLQQYALALDNPPLLIVCDLNTIEIHTNFTNTVHTIHRLTLDDLADGPRRQLLKWALTDPERLKPEQTTAAVTAQAAETFAHLAQRLRERGHEPRQVAHFITRLLFCMFAEDIGLLPSGLFTRLLAAALPQPERFVSMAQSLFAAMSCGGVFGVELIAWFNGGLFNDPAVIPLDAEDLQIAHRAALLDWSAIEPAIFGTLFERGLDPDKRSQLGAHYTDRDSIERLIGPVIREPLRMEWQAVKAVIAARLAKPTLKARQQAEQALQAFLEQLRNFRVLDPACGSGNFLYLALQTLKDLEHQVMLEAEELGLQRGFPAVGPEAVWGIEINPYAAELARVTVWIGEIQWMLSRGYSLNNQPILKPLDQILYRDALLNVDGTEAEWPETEVIIGNPPFLGGSKLLGLLGDQYAKTLRTAYQGRVPGGADLVCYWFEKARALIERGKTQRAGLVATNSIRGGANRKVLERILNTPSPLTMEGEKLAIFNAWSDEDWVNEGAAVRVSLVCFGNSPNPPLQKGGANVVSGGILNGQSVAAIYADLTGSKLNFRCGADLTQAQMLYENAGVVFSGTKKYGLFEIPGDLARQWLLLPNPNLCSNSDVLRPWANGLDVTRRLRDYWIIDFGIDMLEVVAMLYEKPYEYAKAKVKPQRTIDRNPRTAANWWLFERPRPDLRKRLATLQRVLVTPQVAKHRVFAWLDSRILPDVQLYTIARSNDTTFGILHSRFHELWALRLGTSLGDANTPRYTPTTTFETFPFPAGILTHPDQDSCFPAIANAARHLNELRENWLNPSEWVQRLPEIIPGYPDRLIPVNERATAELKKRTLTNLYNQRPTWLVNAHRALDEAVAVAYGWPADLSDEELLWRLLALNQERANANSE